MIAHENFNKWPKTQHTIILQKLMRQIKPQSTFKEVENEKSKNRIRYDGDSDK